MKRYEQPNVEKLVLETKDIVTLSEYEGEIDWGTTKNARGVSMEELQ